MWPFAKRADDIDDSVTEAIVLAEREWRAFNAASPLPANIHLRDRIAYFAAEFRPKLVRAYPSLIAAPPELLLLIIAEGIAASGSHTRDQIELQLGITLPPRGR